MIKLTKYCCWRALINTPICSFDDKVEQKRNSSNIVKLSQIVIYGAEIGYF